MKSHSATFDNFPWTCWKHMSGLSPFGGWFRFCFWSESSLICSWYQVCARYTSGGTLLILYISEADQTEIREPASFVGRNKHFQKITFSICLIFFFFWLCLVFSVVFWRLLCRTSKKVDVSDFLGFMKIFVLALVWMSSYSGILHWGLGFKPQVSKQFRAKWLSFRLFICWNQGTFTQTRALLRVQLKSDPNFAKKQLSFLARCVNEQHKLIWTLLTDNFISLHITKV